MRAVRYCSIVCRVSLWVWDRFVREMDGLAGILGYEESWEMLALFERE